MTHLNLTTLPLSPVAGLRTIELTADQAPILQQFFENNPEYFLATSGEPPGPGEAVEEIVSALPEGWSFTKKWVVGYLDADGRLVAMANVITDFLAPSVFLVGTFIVATACYGTGLAQRLSRGLEQWSLENGAAWMRLGVVVGNTRAERFWHSTGYVPVRDRADFPMGKRNVIVRIMVKPLAAGVLDDYFSLVPRDKV